MAFSVVSVADGKPELALAWVPGLDLLLVLAGVPASVPDARRFFSPTLAVGLLRVLAPVVMSQISRSLLSQMPVPCTVSPRRCGRTLSQLVTWRKQTGRPKRGNAGIIERLMIHTVYKKPPLLTRPVPEF